MFNYFFQPRKNNVALIGDEFHITELSHLEAYPGWEYPVHVHRHAIEFCFVLDGKGKYVYNDEEYPIERGNVIFIDVGNVHGAVSYSESPLNMIVLYIPKDIFPRFYTEKILQPVTDGTKLQDLLESQIAWLEPRLREDESGHWDEIGQMLLHEMILLCTQLDWKEYEPDQLKSYFAYEVLRYMNQNYEKNLTLKELSQVFHCSPSHVSNEFYECYQISPINYLINMRLTVARLHLVATNKTIAEIAELVGYENTAYFQTLFKRRLGISPGQYRKDYAFGRSQGLPYERKSL